MLHWWGHVVTGSGQKMTYGQVQFDLLVALPCGRVWSRFNFFDHTNMFFFQHRLLLCQCSRLIEMNQEVVLLDAVIMSVWTRPNIFYSHKHCVCPYCVFIFPFASLCSFLHYLLVSGPTWRARRPFVQRSSRLLVPQLSPKGPVLLVLEIWQAGEACGASASVQACRSTTPGVMQTPTLSG